MVDLDDIASYRKVDSSDMLGQLYGLPQQCSEAWQRAMAFQLPADYREIDKIIILGMGGSAIGGDLLRCLVSQHIKPVIYINRDYDLPAFTDAKTLVIASSYSGNTEETLTAFNLALKSDCKKVAITGGGKLKEMADAHSVPVFRIEHISAPRAALGYSFIPLIAFLNNLGILKNNLIQIEKMVSALKKLLEEWQECIPEKTNLAKKISRSLFGKIVVVYGAGILAEVARRWKTQINENSKAWAFFEILPELNHNAVVGYQFPEEMLPSLCVVFLRSLSLNPRILMRYQITMDMLQSKGIDYQLADTSGEDDLTRMMSLVYLGDWVSYYLAILYGIDPTPVKVIDYLKDRLGGIQGLLF